MIKLLQSGEYKLLETKWNVKVILLDDQNAYLWTNTGHSGDLECVKLKSDDICCYLALGNFRLYDVYNEQRLKNGFHLELHVGRGKWQGYLLEKNLPTPITERKPIKKTDEIITKTAKKYRLVL